MDVFIIWRRSKLAHIIGAVYRHRSNIIEEFTCK